MSFLPHFGATLDRITGPDGTPASTLVYANEPCAFWQSKGRQTIRNNVNDPPITGQVAMAINRLYTIPGWQGNPPVWNPRMADFFTIHIPGGPNMFVHPVFCGPMWLDTSDVHARFSVAVRMGITATTPTLSFPTGRSDGQTVTFDIRRPFGGALFVSGLVGVFYSDNPIGRGSYSGGNYYNWSHFLDVASGVDIRDGMSRSGGLDVISYADGDEVRIPSGAGVTRYVVVFVAPMRDLTGVSFHRVYLLRDQAFWPMVP